MSAFIKAVFFDIGLTLVTADKKWNTGAKELMVALKGAGIRLGVISNTSNLTRAQLKDLLPADFDFNAFDSNLVLLSSEVRIEKPNLAIFRLAVSRAAIPAGQCVYCSEDPIETMAAQRAGIIGARITPPPNSDLKDLANVIKKVSSLT